MQFSSSAVPLARPAGLINTIGSVVLMASNDVTPVIFTCVTPRVKSCDSSVRPLNNKILLTLGLTCASHTLQQHSGFCKDPSNIGGRCALCFCSILHRCRRPQLTKGFCCRILLLAATRSKYNEQEQGLLASVCHATRTREVPSRKDENDSISLVHYSM